MLKIKKARPVYNGIFVTYDKYNEDYVNDSGIITEKSHVKGSVKEFQTVFRVGDFVKNCKVGDMVQLNLGRYAVRKFHENSVKNDIMENDIVRYAMPLIEIDGVTYMHLQEGDIVAVIEEYEEVDTPSIITAQPKIITLPNSNLVL